MKFSVVERVSLVSLTRDGKMLARWVRLWRKCATLLRRTRISYETASAWAPVR
jgi:hypothetical protein